MRFLSRLTWAFALIFVDISAEIIANPYGPGLERHHHHYLASKFSKPFLQPLSQLFRPLSELIFPKPFPKPFLNPLPVQFPNSLPIQFPKPLPIQFPKPFLGLFPKPFPGLFSKPFSGLLSKPFPIPFPKPCDYKPAPAPIIPWLSKPVVPVQSIVPPEPEVVPPPGPIVSEQIDHRPIIHEIQYVVRRPVIAQVEEIVHKPIFSEYLQSYKFPTVTQHVVKKPVYSSVRKETVQAPLYLPGQQYHTSAPPSHGQTIQLPPKYVKPYKPLAPITCKAGDACDSDPNFPNRRFARNINDEWYPPYIPTDAMDAAYGKDTPSAPQSMAGYTTPWSSNRPTSYYSALTTPFVAQQYFMHPEAYNFWSMLKSAPAENSDDKYELAEQSQSAVSYVAPMPMVDQSQPVVPYVAAVPMVEQSQPVVPYVAPVPMMYYNNPLMSPFLPMPVIADQRQLFWPPAYFVPYKVKTDSATDSANDNKDETTPSPKSSESADEKREEIDEKLEEIDDEAAMAAFNQAIADELSPNSNFWEKMFQHYTNMPKKQLARLSTDVKKETKADVKEETKADVKPDEDKLPQSLEAIRDFAVTLNDDQRKMLLELLSPEDSQANADNSDYRVSDKS